MFYMADRTAGQLELTLGACFWAKNWLKQRAAARESNPAFAAGALIMLLQHAYNYEINKKCSLHTIARAVSSSTLWQKSYSSVQSKISYNLLLNSARSFVFG
jgi:hypothetical protein